MWTKLFVHLDKLPLDNTIAGLTDTRMFWTCGHIWGKGVVWTYCGIFAKFEKKMTKILLKNILLGKTRVKKSHATVPLNFDVWRMWRLCSGMSIWTSWWPSRTTSASLRTAASPGPILIYVKGQRNEILNFFLIIYWFILGLLSGEKWRKFL